MQEFGKIFKAFMEHITWTNYGGPIVTILGRDIMVFITGFITHLCIGAFVEIIKEKNTWNGLR